MNTPHSHHHHISIAEFIALFALLMSLTALSIDAMLPALPNIGEDLGVSDSNDTQLVISMFFLGTVFGELLFGAFADAYGRRAAVFSGVSIYLMGTLLAIFADSMWILLLGRVLQGFGISGSKIGSRALIRDLFVGDQMARIMSVIMTLFIFVPMLAPFLGQLIMLQFDWRAIFIFFFVFAIVVTSWFGLRQHETLVPEKRRPLSLSGIIRSGKLIIRHQKVMAYMVVTGITFGAMLVYLSTAQSMFSDFYDVNEDFPIYFAIIAAGVGMAAVVNSKIVVKFGMHRVSKWALIGMTLAGSMLAISGVLNNGVPPFLAFMLGFLVILFCMGFIFGNMNAMAMEWLGGMAGLGNSVVGSLSSLTAVLVAVIAGRFYTDNIYPVALCFVAVSVISLYLLYFAKRAPGEAL